MKNSSILEILKNAGGFFTDNHFVYTSGKHGDTYLNKDAIYPHTEAVSQVGKMFAEKHQDLDIDVVVAPALGGIPLSQWTAHHLSKIKNKEILAIYAEKTADKKLAFTRNYDKLVTGKNVLVIEDITNTGKSVQKLISSVKEIGGNIIAVSVMINRDPKEVNRESIGFPFSALETFEAEAFNEANCPLCQQNIPINTDMGHGRKYLEAKNQK